MLDISFYYMALTQANLKASYMMKDGIPVFERNMLSCVVFPAMNFENIAVVKRFCGKYIVKEL